jgi:DNA invertase Pin-like site-specific DNA recombinase
MLTVLGGLAEFERHLILIRTSEGRTRAKANGVRFGRKPKLTDYQQAEVIRRRKAGETLTALAKSFGVAHSMISRLTTEVQQWRKQRPKNTAARSFAWPDTKRGKQSKHKSKHWVEGQWLIPQPNSLRLPKLS